MEEQINMDYQYLCWWSDLLNHWQGMVRIRAYILVLGAYQFLSLDAELASQ